MSTGSSATACYSKLEPGTHRSTPSTCPKIHMQGARVVLRAACSKFTRHKWKVSPRGGRFGRTEDTGVVGFQASAITKSTAEAVVHVRHLSIPLPPGPSRVLWAVGTDQPATICRTPWELRLVVELALFLD